jgi:hypothetical protein
MPNDDVTLTPATTIPSGMVGPGDGRDRRGRFAAGNTAHVTTGARSAQYWAAVDGERTALRRQLLADRGFTDEAEAPAALRLMADGAAQAALIRDGSFARLVESGGPVTSTDRARRIFTVWLAATTRALRHLEAIGLERKPKETTLSDYLARASAGSK